jgi:predicted 3-demethylubiquinone-9 3-methyltransferase (glyoxalase superfamily)
MAQKFTTFLMFEGKAEEAMTFYTSTFKDSKVIAITRYGKEGPGPEGSVVHATFSLGGQEFMAIDSPAKHAFTFTPSISIFVNCEDEAELDGAAEKLVEGGKFLMPPDNYGFSKKFAWVADRFGVTWQLTLPLEINAP